MRHFGISTCCASLLIVVEASLLVLELERPEEVVTLERRSRVDTRHDRVQPPLEHKPTVLNVLRLDGLRALRLFGRERGVAHIIREAFHLELLVEVVELREAAEDHPGRLRARDNNLEDDIPGVRRIK